MAPVRGEWNTFDKITITASTFLVIVLLTLPTFASDLRSAISDMGDTLPWFTRWAIHPAVPRLLGIAAAVPLLLAWYRRPWRRYALRASMIAAAVAVGVCAIGLLWPHWFLVMSDSFNGT